jgi:hypothetical protein
MGASVLGLAGVCARRPGVMDMHDSRKVREKAARARRLAKSVTDKQTCEALEALAAELDRQVAEVERQGENNDNGGPDSPKRP